MEMREKIIVSGVKYWPLISLRRIAADVGCSHTNVLYHFDGSAMVMKAAIIERAIAEGNSRVIASLICIGDPSVKGMSQTERLRHMKAAAGQPVALRIIQKLSPCVAFVGEVATIAPFQAPYTKLSGHAVFSECNRFRAGDHFEETFVYFKLRRTHRRSNHSARRSKD